MELFKKAKWIWALGTTKQDDYVEFSGSFLTKDKKATISIACDTVYAFYLNDKLIKFMACSDFPDDKYVDVFDAETICGKNQFKIQVWHYGENTASYIKDDAGLIFEIADSSGIIAYSNENVSSRIMNEYKNGYSKFMTRQLGNSFFYDARVDAHELAKTKEYKKHCNYSVREINNIELHDRTPFFLIKREKSIIVDLKKETTGFIDLDIESPCDQLIKIGYGEHIADGGVRYNIFNSLNFTFEICLKKGHNIIFNPLRRIAGRYLEIFYEEDIQINYAGIRPVCYQHEVIRKDYGDELINKIYNTSIYTLEQCMHEHYEDCPWREQALYVLDSRNQMLCGYYVFKGFEYQKHNIILLSKGYQKDTGLLTLTTPCGSSNYPIPFFSLMYIKQVEEYIKYTGDREILNIVEDTLTNIINSMISRIDDNGLVYYFRKPFWNFYEWTDGSANDEDLRPDSKEKEQYELMINAALVYSIESYNRIFDKNIDTSKLKEAIVKKFYDEKHSVFVMNDKTDKASQLGNAFACLIGLGNDELIEKLSKSEEMVEASLSVRGFVYDALLTKKGKYEDFIIDDIKNRYQKMLDKGATTFWETEKGEADFGGAGSLCHGWSAIPIYYFNELLKK